jgi:hypothetical protein
MRPADDSTQICKIMGEDVVTLNMSSANPSPLMIGDYLYFTDKKYTLNAMPYVREVNSRYYDYSLKFEADSYNLLKVQYMLFDDPTLPEIPPSGDFSLMGDAATFLNLLVKNLNRTQSGWSIGEVIETTARNLTFTNENCMSVLQRLATEFDTEYWFSEPRIINFGKQTYSGEIIQLAYGRGNGLKEITRTNRDSSGIITRLYAFGSERNIKSGYRDGAKRLMLPGGDYIENNVDKYGIIESTEVFDDIYPRLNAGDREDAPGVVTGIDGIYRFSDSNLDFNLNNCLLPGIAAKVVFTSGQLSGYEFEIQSFANESKTFTIIRAEYENALELPSALIHAGAGDRYVLIDVDMPEQYIQRAEEELAERASENLVKNSDVRDALTCTCDTIHFKNNNIMLNPAQEVHIYAPELGIERDIRIVGIVRNINEPFEHRIEISDTVAPSRIDRIQTNAENAERTVSISKLRDPNYIRRNWRDVQEVLNMVFDPDGYFTDKIRPLSIETSMLAVGARSQQFDFVDMIMKPNYDADPSRFAHSAGTLVHFTISETDIPEWTIAENIIEDLVDGEAYYIYAKCNRENGYGEIVAEVNAYKTDADPSVYYFLIGVLNSVNEDVRSFKPTFGFSEIAGGYITTGIIQSRDGRTKFDLNDSIIDLNSRAGMTGKGNAVRAWFGGTYQDALNSLASVIFNDNGSGQLAKGNIAFDENGNVVIAGKFETSANGKKVIIDNINKNITVSDDNMTYVVIDYSLETAEQKPFPKITLRSEVGNSEMNITSSYITMTSEGETQFQLGGSADGNSGVFFIKKIETSPAGPGYIYSNNGVLRIGV